MINILFTKNGGFYRYKTTPYRTVKDLFANIDSVIHEIPEKDRVNLYFTPYDCLDSQDEKETRNLTNCTELLLDLDHIDMSQYQRYIDTIIRELDVNPDDVATVHSGNGIHMYFTCLDYRSEDEMFNVDTGSKFVAQYQAFIGRIANILWEAGLPQGADTVDKSGMIRKKVMRLPNTTNYKPDRGEVQCRLLTKGLNRLNKTIYDLIGIPPENFTETINTNIVTDWYVDTQGVLEGCDFLKHCHDNPNDISEPQWFQMVSLLSHCEDSELLVHEYSKGYDKYKERETQRKYETIKRAKYKPPTCSGIQLKGFDCRQCPNFGKVQTPASIKNEDYIKSASSGFWITKVEVNGDKKTIVPTSKLDYDGLFKYFCKRHPYKCTTSNDIYSFTGTHWTLLKRKYVEEFVNNNVNSPSPQNKHRMEFISRVESTNIADIAWYDDNENCVGFTNFKNGILNLKTRELIPHSKNFPFRYVLPFDYDPDAKAPAFDACMEDLFSGNKDFIDIVLQYIAYGVSGYPNYKGQKCLLLAGTKSGSNGKGVLCRIIQHIVGEGNYGTANVDSNLDRDVHQFSGKLFNFSNETDYSAFNNSNAFKQLVAGDKTLCKQVYKDTFTITPTAKLIMSCNSLPRMDIYNPNGVGRRLLIVQMKKHYAQGDGKYSVDIVDNIVKEASGIYNRVLDAYDRFIANKGFVTSKSLLESYTEFEKENIPITDWFVSNTVQCDTEVETPINVLFSNYEQHYGVYSKTRMIPAMFGKYLMRLHDVPSVLKRVDGKPQKVLRGIRLKTDEELCGESL